MILKSSSWLARSRLLHRVKLDAHSQQISEGFPSIVNYLELEPEQENCNKFNPGNAAKLTEEAVMLLQLIENCSIGSDNFFIPVC